FLPNRARKKHGQQQNHQPKQLPHTHHLLSYSLIANTPSIKQKAFVQEKRERPCRFDGHKTGWRSGVLCRIARLAYDPRIWALELDNKKSRGSRLLKLT